MKRQKLKRGSKIINNMISGEIATVKYVDKIRDMVDFKYYGDKTWHTSSIKDITIVEF